jgi:hypothetical protein
MKKIILITVLFLGLHGFSQKIVYVFNFSSYGVDIGEFQTKNSTGGFPYFRSYPFLVHINAGDSYTLENNGSSTKFPFVSVGNTPQLNSWVRTNSATSSTTVTSTTAYISGASQLFNFIKFQVGTNGSLGGGNLGASPFLADVVGTGWLAHYDPATTDPLNPNLQEYVITIFDN